MLCAVMSGHPPLKKHTPSKKPTSNPSLPYDLIVSILACVPRLYYPNISFVSKSFRSILYQTQTLLNCTETFLYVCLRFPDETNLRWFILHRKPNQTLTNQTIKKKKKKETSSINLLAPVSFLNSPHVEWSTIIFVGSQFDGHVYLAGSSVIICMIKNITYYYDRNLRWRKNNTKGAVWKTLPGLEGLPKFANYCTVKLVDYGGKLVVLWDKYVPASGYKEKMIWCAEISIEKRNSEEIWEKIEWFDAVLTVPKSYKFLCVKYDTL